MGAVSKQKFCQVDFDYSEYFQSFAMGRLIARLDFWFKKKPFGFYKFIEPAHGNPKYHKNDSITEECHIGKTTFHRCFDQIGVRYKSKTSFDQTKDKFKGKPYAAYHNKIQRIYVFLKNPEFTTFGDYFKTLDKKPTKIKEAKPKSCETMIVTTTPTMGVTVTPMTGDTTTPIKGVTFCIQDKTETKNQEKTSEQDKTQHPVDALKNQAEGEAKKTLGKSEKQNPPFAPLLNFENSDDLLFQESALVDIAINCNEDASMIKENKPAPRKAKSVDKVVGSASSVVSLFAKTPSVAISEFKSKANPYKAPINSATGLYNLWRDAVVEFYPDVFLASPTAQVSVQCKHLIEKTRGLINDTEWYKFMMNLMYQWSVGNLQSWLSQNTSIVQTPKYPEIGFILKNASYFVTWYKQTYCQVDLPKVQSTPSSNTPHKSNLQNSSIGIKESTTLQGNELGCTYITGKKYDIKGAIVGTYEEFVANAVINGDTQEELMFYEQLKSHTIDISASDLKISDLVKAAK